jgi:4-hydroxy-tetrahydrodipicolinate reductase
VIRVGVLGALGRMGTTVSEAVAAAPDLALGGRVDKDDALDGLRGSDVVVCFTAAGQAVESLRWCSAAGIHAVIGTTGWDEAGVAELRRLFPGPPAGPNAVLAANFAIGAVLLMRMAEMAAPHFDTAEVIELHHDGKADAPSGTAVATAERMAGARDAAGAGDFGADPTTSDVLPGARGAAAAANIRVHSVRMRGMVAHQEVILGTTGQTLTLRHDTVDRQSFMPGVLLAVRGVADRPGLTVGLDALLGL